MIEDNQKRVELRARACCYITRETALGVTLLVFEHDAAYDDGAVGIQVVGGGIEPREEAGHAALRETLEETGLALPHAYFLGQTVRIFEETKHQPRFYFWLPVPNTLELPQKWSHTVSSGEIDQGHLYHHRFELLETIGELEWDLHEMLPELHKRLQTRVKVCCYITRQTEQGYALLTTEFLPDWGIHVVGGGVDAGEDLAQAARREALEETGLTALSEPIYLGQAQHRYPENSSYVPGKLEQKHFFWFQTPSETPNFWEHRVSEGHFDKGKPMQHRFIPLEHVQLDGNFGALLGKLKDVLKENLEQDRENKELSND